LKDPSLHPYIIYFVPGGDGVIEYFARGNTFDSGSHKGITLARFYMLELNNGIDITV
jgi:hypothetical protein